MNFKKIIFGAVILVILYIFYTTVFSDKSNNSLVEMHSALENPVNIPYKKLYGSGSTDYTYSFWIYINDYNQNYGDKKMILERKKTVNNNTFYFPQIYLGENQNDIHFKISKPEITTKYEFPKKDDDCDDLPPDYDFIETADDCLKFATSTSGYTWDGKRDNANLPKGCYYIHNDKKVHFAKNGNKKSGVDSDGSIQNFQICAHKQTIASDHEIVVHNIPLQKWNHVIMTKSGLTIDIYIDGKLVKTSIMDTTAYKPDAETNIDLTSEIGNAIGFSGYLSKVIYRPGAVNTREAYQIYKEGNGTSGLGSFFNRFKLKFAFMQDNQEKSSIIF
jgi:hypothetical protein